MIGRARRSVLPLIAIAIASAGARAQTPVRAVIALSGEGASYSGRLESASPDQFRITLPAGAFLEIVVEQRGLDVALRLFDPANQQVLETDRPSYDNGPERIARIVGPPGDYRVEVFRSGAGNGSYELHVRALRPPTARDTIEANGEAAYVDGGVVAKANTADSRRRAAESYVQAASIFDSIGERYEAMLSLTRASTMRMLSGEPRQALELLPRALATAEDLRETRLHASLLSLMGGAHQVLGNLPLAMEHYQRALDLVRALGQNPAAMLNNVGVIYHDMADYQQSLTFYRQALDAYSAINDARREGITRNNIGIDYLALGEFDLAMDAFEGALALNRKAGDKAGEADTLTAEGDVHRFRGEPQRALDVYALAMPLRLAVGDHNREAITLSAMADAHADLGHIDQAVALHEQALTLRRAAGDRRNEALGLESLSRVMRHQPARALELARQALEIDRRLDDRQGIAAALSDIAHAERDLGRLDDADSHALAALDAAEEVRARVGAAELRSQYLARQRATYMLAIDVLARLDRERPGRGYAARALEINERSRARSLLELLNSAGARITHGGDPALLERERRLAQEINGKGDRLLRASTSATEREAIARELRALEAEHDDVRAEIRRTSPGFASLTQARPTSVADIQQRMLDADTTLVEYAIGDEVSYAWTVDRDRVAVYALARGPAIASAVDHVRQRLTVRPRAGASSAPLNRAIRHLSDLVIAPIEGGIRGTRLAIVADGPLEYVPFAVLRRAGPAARMLVATTEIVSLPSASALVLVREQALQRERPSRGIAVLADPTFESASVAKHQSLPVPTVARDTARLLVHTGSAGTVVADRIPSLPFTRVEAASILRAASSRDNMRAVGADATRDLMLGGTLRPFQYVHLATHGYVDAEHPNLSSLVLSTVDASGQPRDGFVRAHEIYNLDLLADLVVLSACETGLGRAIKGEGLVGLTRGFMYAGAPRVVVSLWSVSDRATAALMGGFYADMLQRGLPPAAALRAAQRRMMADPRWSHPYYWAAFVLNGEWR